MVLGCTHYPLVAPMLQRTLGRDVRLVTAGHAIAADVQRVLDERGLSLGSGEEGEYRFLCTGDPESFRKLGTRFLQMPVGKVEWSSCRERRRLHPPGYALSILEQVQEDVKTAMKAGEKERVGQLRMIVNALQQEDKEGKGDEVAALQRERKRRLDAAEALREGGRDGAGRRRGRRGEADRGLPARAALRRGALASWSARRSRRSGATEPKDMGDVMKALMPKVGGRADGKRVSQAVREKLGS